MSDSKQIFQTKSKWRWHTVKWSARLVILSIVLVIPVVLITLAKGLQPSLPKLISDEAPLHRLVKPTTPAALKDSELKKYKGFSKFLQAKAKMDSLNKTYPVMEAAQVRAAFYVDWDPQSFFSLQKNIDKLNMVLPEWFFIDPKTDTLQPNIDLNALQVMKKNQIKIIPIINNINQTLGVGEFDGKMMHRILNNTAKKERLLNDIIKYIHQYQLQGINIDFEELSEKTDEPIIAFQKEIYTRLHAENLIVTQDIMPGNEDFNAKSLAAYNDYLFLMAYDEHYSTSTPGNVSSQQFIEKVLDETAAGIPSNKIILCFAGYGYDWAAGSEGETVTYQQALSNAKINKANITFDNSSYNNNYNYTDGNKVKHQVYFADAATNFNTIRFADEYGVGGTALWRLGSEDERLWSFYNRSLSNKSIADKPVDFSLMKTIEASLEKPDYVGDGEVLNVITKPEPGKINLEYSKEEGMITEQNYLQLPTKYVIQKYGNVHKQVVLTFDDGPDPEYTPQILEILKKENVPAAFFVVGMEAEANLPLLKRIFNEGHEIGNHTFTHPNIAAVGEERAKAEIESTRLLIEAATGRSTILFRAPYNADAEPTTQAELKPIELSKEKNYYTVGESIDPNDWEVGITADTVYERTIKQYEANPDKGIILFHDAGGNRQATVDALPRIIKYFKDRGIQFTTIASLLHTTKDVVMPAVSNNLINLNGGIATAGYFLERFLTTAFWIAIILGFIRILLMAVMALMQKRKTQKLALINPTTITDWPAVSIIVPAFNEEVNAVKTIENLLAQNYPNYNIIFIDDGSTDNTYSIVRDRFLQNEQVIVLTKRNGGKASALNVGIDYTKNEYVICIDADTQLQNNALTELMTAMLSSGNINVGAVAGNVKVGNQHNLLTKWQSIEYTTAQAFDRRAFDLVNGISVVPGAIGAFKVEAIQKAGGFTSDTLAEDCDLTIRILRNGYRIVNCPTAIAVTEAPETLPQFLKQRFRWSYGIMQAFWKNRDACFNPKFKGLGLLSLPNIFVFQILLPMFAPLADLMLVFSLFWNRQNPESMHKIWLFYLVFMLVDIFVSIIAFIFEKEKLGKIIWLLPQRLVYRQLMYYILFKSIRKALKGESQAWGVLKRTGSVQQLTKVSIS